MEGEITEDDCIEDDYGEEEEDCDELDELCSGMNRIRMEGEKSRGIWREAHKIYVQQ